MNEAIIGAAISIFVGLACFVISLLNMKGNISMLHSYHTNNISEEDKIPFGRRVGVGMLFVANSLIIYGGLFIPAELTKNNIYMIVANIVLAVGLTVGLAICLLAIKKYNKTII